MTTAKLKENYEKHLEVNWTREGKRRELGNRSALKQPVTYTPFYWSSGTAPIVRGGGEEYQIKEGGTNAN